MPAVFAIRDDGDTYALYQYTPSLTAACIATALFAIATLLHVIKASRLRVKLFIPFIFGLLFETIGYGGRIWSHFEKQSIPAYIIQSLLILVAPALFAASIYMILGRIIAFVDGERQSLIPLRWLTKLFVIGDCVSFFVQICGGGIQAAGTLSLLQLGEKIIVVGLFIQIFMFGFFVVVAIAFEVRYRRSRQSSPNFHIHWQKIMQLLYITSAIILVRSVFRVVEYLMGNKGYILRHEFMLYIFDAVLMFLVAVIFYFSNVGNIVMLRNPDRRTKSSHVRSTNPPRRRVEKFQF